jgi:hypothetical protein
VRAGFSQLQAAASAAVRCDARSDALQARASGAHRAPSAPKSSALHWNAPKHRRRKARVRQRPKIALPETNCS